MLTKKKRAHRDFLLKFERTLAAAEIREFGSTRRKVFQHKPEGDPCKKCNYPAEVHGKTRQR